jgi:hypothetical protein
MHLKCVSLLTSVHLSFRNPRRGTTSHVPGSIRNGRLVEPDAVVEDIVHFGDVAGCFVFVLLPETINFLFTFCQKSRADKKK